MTERGFTLDPPAEADLEALARYIAEHDGGRRAALVIARIEKTLQNLAFMPRMGRPTRHLNPATRRFPAQPWIIYYDPTPTGIHVLRIVDGRRDLRALFGPKP